MKKKEISKILFALAFIISPVLMQAQGNGQVAEKHEQRVQKLIQELNMTAEQQAQFTEMHERMKTQTAEVRDQKLTADERKEAMKAIQQSHQEELSALLTEEQKMKLEAIKKDRKAKRAGRVAPMDRTFEKRSSAQ